MRLLYLSWLKRILIIIATAACLSASLQSGQTFAATPVEIVPNIPHAMGVSSAVFSPDGRLVVSSGMDSTVKLWDAATGRLLRTFIGHAEPVNSVAVSPDGGTVASGGNDDTVKLWEVSTGRLLHTFSQNTPVHSIQFSPDGKRLLFAGSGLNLIDVATGEFVLRIDEPNATVVTMSIDGSRILSGGNFGNSVKMWDSVSGRLVREFSGLAPTNVPIFTPNSDGISPVAITSVAFSPDGRRIMAGSSDRKLYNRNEVRDHVVNIWDSKTGQLLRTFSGHSDSIDALAFSPDGKVACSASSDKTIKIWDAGSGKILRTISINGFVTAVAFSPDGKEVLSGDGGLRLWDAETGNPKREFGNPNIFPVDSASVSPTGTDLVSGSDNGVVRLWDLTSGVLRQSFVGGSLVGFLPDGKRLLSSAEDGVKLWDAMDTRPLRSFGGPRGWRRAVAVSHDGTRVLLGSKQDDQPLELWDIASGTLVRRFMGFSSANSVAFSPDGRVIGAGLGSAAKFWETDSGKSLRAYTPFPNWEIASFTFSHDGTKVLFGGSARTSLSPSGTSNLKLVDAASGQTLHDFFGHSSYVTSVAISRDDTHALSGSSDGTVRVWDLSSARLLYTFIGSQGGINTVLFSPDDKRALSAGADGAIRMWNLGNGELLVSIFELGDDDWVAITPEGFFVSSEHGAEHLSVVQGLKVFGIDQLFQSLYRPDLVREKLAGDPLGRVKEAAAKLDLDKVIASGEAPRIRLSEPSSGTHTKEDHTTISAEVTSRGGGIGRVEWRVNGLTLGIDENTRASSAGPVILRRTVPLEDGQNTIEVVAYNVENLVASAPMRITVISDMVSNIAPRLYVLAIGVNDYWDSRLRLAFPVADAKALASAFQAAGKGLYESVTVTTVFDQDVTRSRLDEIFSAVAKDVRPRDVFVFFIAGHGKTVDGRYYFIPQDFRYVGAVSIAAQGISQEQFQVWFSKILAKKSVLLFDTCESGSLTGDRLETRGLEQVASLERLTHAMGRTVLSASTDDKPALEGYRGHGVFTYALLDAFEHGDTNGDGYLEVTELAGYIDTEVPDISMKVFNFRQVPQMKLMGSDFPLAKSIAVLDASAEKTSIVIPNKPTHVVIKPTEVFAAPNAHISIQKLDPGTLVAIIRSAKGWTLVAKDGNVLGYVAQGELAPLH